MLSSCNIYDFFSQEWQAQPREKTKELRGRRQQEEEEEEGNVKKYHEMAHT